MKSVKLFSLFSVLFLHVLVGFSSGEINIDENSNQPTQSKKWKRDDLVSLENGQLGLRTDYISATQMYPTSMGLNSSKLEPFSGMYWWLSVLLVGSVMFFVGFKFKDNMANKNEKLKEKLIELPKKMEKQTSQNEVPVVVIKCSGKLMKVPTQEILYFKSAGNYIEIFTENTRLLVRGTLNDIYEKIPDKMRFLQMHRSFYVRAEKVTQKGTKTVSIQDVDIPVSKTYLENLTKINF